MTPLLNFQKEWRVASGRSLRRVMRTRTSSDRMSRGIQSARCGGRCFEAKRRRSFVVEMSQPSTIGVHVRVAALPQASPLPVESGSTVRRFRFELSTVRVHHRRAGGGRARCFDKGAKEHGLTGLLQSLRNAARRPSAACHYADDELRAGRRRDRGARHSPGHSATGRRMLHSRMRAG